MNEATLRILEFEFQEPPKGLFSNLGQNHLFSSPLLKSISLLKSDFLHGANSKDSITTLSYLPLTSFRYSRISALK